MIPLAVPNLDGNEAKYLQECVQSTFVSSLGPFVDRFETDIAFAAGTKRAVVTSSGTSGLHLALKTVGVEANDLVIVPTYTFIASANAIAHCGATPWLIDIEPETWTLDPRVLENELASNTRRIDGQLFHRQTNQRVMAIMPVYTLGLPAKMREITSIASDFLLPIVADSAAALGATYYGAPTGQLGATLSVYSFNGNKTMTAGGGGAVVGDDDHLLDLAKHLSTTARVGPDYHHDKVGFNYRMTNLQAAVGVAQLERLDQFVEAKRRISDAYKSAFSGASGIKPFPKPEWANSACWFSGIYVEKAARSVIVDIQRSCLDRGIDFRPFWKPVHMQPPFKNAPGGPYPVAEEIWEGVITLPCSTGLSEDDQATVIKALLSVLD
jgi:perosamine synthetase